MCYLCVSSIFVAIGRSEESWSKELSWPQSVYGQMSQAEVYCFKYQEHLVKEDLVSFRRPVVLGSVEGTHISE